MKDRVAEIVAAYVGHNILAPDQLPALIASVSQALSGLGQAAPPAATARPPPPCRSGAALAPSASPASIAAGPVRCSDGI
jgi:predicted transcriptional regulator